MATRTYFTSRIYASSLRVLRDYINEPNSASLGPKWGHRVHTYSIYYHDEVKHVQSFDEVSALVREHGDSRFVRVYFESSTGRIVDLDASNPTRTILRVENGAHSEKTLDRIEVIMHLQSNNRRVFLTHGRSNLWFEVARFIEKDCHPALPTLELASRPNQGRTIIEKLEQEAVKCSYAVIVMTGEDLAADEVRARENVIHEIGFFQGCYGRSRVCLLHEEGVNIPSNLQGLVYCGFQKGQPKTAFLELERDLREAFP